MEDINDINKLVFYIAYIDIVDACNLACVTCPRSSIKGTGIKMDYKKFCKILDKLKFLNTRMIGLYNWSEPFLHPELLTFVKEVKQRSMICSISSNLSLPNIPNLLDVLDVLKPNDGDHVIVSISGLSQSVYEINHKRGKIETVKRHLETASYSENKSALRLRLIRFDYNRNEEKELIEFCKRLGIHYEIINGSGDPLRKEVEITGEEITPAHYNRDLNSLAPCRYIFDQICINSEGDVHLCCCAPPLKSYNLGSFLEQDLNIITIKRYFHPRCATCTIPVRRKFYENDLNILINALKHCDKDCSQPDGMTAN